MVSIMDVLAVLAIYGPIGDNHRLQTNRPVFLFEFRYDFFFSFLFFISFTTKQQKKSKVAFRFCIIDF